VIEAVTPQRCTLASDLGLTETLPHPAAGLRDYVAALWTHGLAEEDLRMMVCDNPARMLDLEG
jgi:predicted metal-dependent phosphotriesterase family hydrolase